MATELELHWQVSVTVPPTFEQASEQPPCLTNHAHMKDADKEHDNLKNNLNPIFLTILSGVRQTNPKIVFFSFFFRGFAGSRYCISQRLQAPVVQTLDSAIHWINHYPLDNSIGFASVYPLASDLSGGQRYPSNNWGLNFQHLS